MQLNTIFWKIEKKNINVSISVRQIFIYLFIYSFILAMINFFSFV